MPVKRFQRLIGVAVLALSASLALGACDGPPLPPGAPGTPETTTNTVPAATCSNDGSSIQMYRGQIPEVTATLKDSSDQLPIGDYQGNPQLEYQPGLQIHLSGQFQCWDSKNQTLYETVNNVNLDGGVLDYVIGPLSHVDDQGMAQVSSFNATYTVQKHDVSTDARPFVVNVHIWSCSRKLASGAQVNTGDWYDYKSNTYGCTSLTSRAFRAVDEH